MFFSISLKWYTGSVERYFTIESATHALAIVRPILTDLVVKVQRLESLSKDEQAEQSEETQKLCKEIEYHVHELETVGVVLKDAKLGLVDFPCMHENRLVYLCWMLGEAEVSFWHEVKQGFTQRKRIDARFKVAVV